MTEPADKQNTFDVVVVGGGISGLSTAYRLQKSGLRVLLTESQGRCGGSIASERLDDFLIDYGPNSTLETSPAIREFVDELGLAERRVYANDTAKKRYVVRNARLQALPTSPPAFLATSLFSARAKLRLLREPFIAPAPENKEETIAEFVERRLGQEFLDYAINPFIAGVYAGDPKRLSVRSAVAKIYALEKNYGSLIKGAIKGAKARKQRGETDKTRARLFSFREGMAELPDTLERQLDSVWTHAKVRSLDVAESGEHIVRISRGGEMVAVRCRCVVLTTPAPVTAHLLEPMQRKVAKELETITYPPVAVVYFGYREAQSRPLDGFGFLVPEVEKRNILGTIWSSTIFPGRAPAGGIALTTFVGGMRQPELAELPEEKLLEVVRAELSSLISLKGEPDIVRLRQWPRAIPQYQLGHKAKMAAVDRFEQAFPGIVVSGNFRGGISLSDCLLQSDKVAERVHVYCSQRLEKDPVAS